MSRDECRPVEVDGEVIPVLGGREMDATDRAAFAEIVRAAKRHAAKWACPDCPHSLMFHDIDTIEDPKPRCCVRNCTCGAS